MSYEERVGRAISEKSESGLVALIEEEIEATEESVRAKESALNGLAQLYVDRNEPGQIQSIA